MDYFVLDLETANPDYASICQIGFVEVRAGSIVDEVSALIDPDDYFDPINISIHGIDPGQISSSPQFDKIYPDIFDRLSDSIIVHHGPFDRIAIQRACNRYSLKHLPAHWLDNQKVVRRTWDQFSKRGYSLKNLSQHFQIEFEHHDALEDARATEKIFRLALQDSGLSPIDWIDRVGQPIATGKPSDISRTGSDSGPFNGETIVFTGALKIPRKEAADVAQSLGFNVASSVTKKTTFLCVGIQGRDKLAGYAKSSKHRKADQMVSKGHEIAIVSEADFWALTKS